MGRGNIFMGYVAGKIGDTVFSVSHGKQLERAYNPNKYDAKTNSQVLKRSKWANASLFYSRSTKATFKFAYQDMRKNESAQNVFMRNNAERAMRTIPSNVTNFKYPSIGLYLMSRGVIKPLQFCWANGRFRSYITRYHPENPNLETLGQLSQALVTLGYKEGQIVTITLIKTDATLGSEIQPIVEGTYQPEYETIQFIIDTNSSANLEQMNLFGVEQSTNQFIWGVNERFAADTNIGAGMIQVSEVVNNKVQVSDAELVLTPIALAALSLSCKISWRDIVLQAWGATGDAVLNGSQAVNARSNYDVFMNYDFALPTGGETMNNKYISLSKQATASDVARHLMIFNTQGVRYIIEVAADHLCKIKTTAGIEVGELQWQVIFARTWKIVFTDTSQEVAGILWY